MAHAEFSHGKVAMPGAKEDASTIFLGMKLLVRHFTQHRHTTRTLAIPPAGQLGENRYYYWTRAASRLVLYEPGTKRPGFQSRDDRNRQTGNTSEQSDNPGQHGVANWTHSWRLKDNSGGLAPLARQSIVRRAKQARLGW